MPRENASLAFKLSLIGSILIFLNGIWIAVNAGPIVLTTDPALTTVEAVRDARVFWGRISFGNKGMVEGLWTPFWLVFTIALFGCIIQIYRKPRRHKGLALPMIIFSLLSFPIGGGLLVGLILAFIGGMLALEWPKPFGDTFIGKMARAAKLDSKLIRELSNDPQAMRAGVSVLVFIGIAMGLGNAIYVSNANIIETQSAAAHEILFLGGLNMDAIAIANAASFVGIIFWRWLILSLILYVFTVKLKGYIADFNKFFCATAFAFVPLCLQLFLPVLFSNEPYLSFHWPFAILLFSTLWVAVAVIALIRNMFEIGTREALGTTIFAVVLYWFIDNLLVVSNPAISMPGVSVEFAPGSSGTILLLISLATLLAVLLGAFTTEQST